MILNIIAPTQSLIHPYPVSVSERIVPIVSNIEILVNIVASKTYIQVNNLLPNVLC